MEHLDALGFLIVTLNCNVTIVGKVWLVCALLLRLALLVLAASPVYRDEQERFVCNTLQPGCANVCYDAFAPVSPLRLWLLQGACALLPSAVFLACVLHRGAALAARGPPQAVPDCAAAYVAHLLLRTLLEAAFGAGHYLLFGLRVPGRVACARPPCSGAVDCYVSRPTEKSILALCVCALGAGSLLLSLADLACSLRGRGAPGGLPITPGPWRGAGGGARVEEPLDADRGGDGVHAQRPASGPRSLLAPERPSSSRSAPHLRPQKSEWV